MLSRELGNILSVQSEAILTSKFSAWYKSTAVKTKSTFLGRLFCVQERVMKRNAGECDEKHGALNPNYDPPIQECFQIYIYTNALDELSLPLNG